MERKQLSYKWTAEDQQDVDAWDRARDADKILQNTPLTFQEIEVGTCFICYPIGDGTGHSKGYRAAYHVFEKLSNNFENCKNAEAFGSKAKLYLPPHMQVMKVLT